VQKNPTNGFIVSTKRGLTAAILAKNVRQGGSSGQTGSRNMAATRFFGLLVPDFLFDPQYIRGSISHRYGATPGTITIAPLLRPPATRNIPSQDGDIANFERIFLEFQSSEFHDRSKTNVAVERRQQVENLTTRFRAKVGQSTPKIQISNPPCLPQMGADSPQTKTIFLRVASAIRCMGQMGGCELPKGVNPKSAPKVPHPQLRAHISRNCRI